MWSILADLVVGIFDFALDVLLFRGLRRKHGQRNRSVAEDTVEVARFDFVTLTFIALVSVGDVDPGARIRCAGGLEHGHRHHLRRNLGLWRYVQLVRE